MTLGMVPYAVLQARRRERRQKRRRLLAEVKFGLQRVMMYVGLANFLLLLTIALKWTHDAMFPATSFYAFVGAGWLLAVAGLVLLILIDRTFVIRHEAGIGAKLHPLVFTEAFRSAKHIAELEAEGLDCSVELVDLREAFRTIGIAEKFEQYLERARRRVRRKVLLEVAQ